MPTIDVVAAHHQVVSAGSVQASGFKLQNHKSAPTQTSAALDGVASTVDATIITVTLTLDSANEVRALTSLATSDQNTFLLIDNTAFTDTDANAAYPVLASDATQVTSAGYQADITEPLAEKFKLDLTTGKMMVKYEQPVNGASVDPTTFTLTSSAAGALSSHTLSVGCTTSQDVDTWFTMTLTKTDLDQIKKLDVCDNVNAEAGCFLRFGANSVTDATGLPIVSIASAPAALPCIAYTADATAPTLLDSGFVKLNLNNGEMTLTFSETIDLGSLSPSKISLRRSNIDDASIPSQTLSGLTMVRQP
jgi:hypothetical protein